MQCHLSVATGCMLMARDVRSAISWAKVGSETATSWLLLARWTSTRRRRCKAPDGGKPCKRDGCTTSARDGSDFCVAHGGGPRCARRTARGRLRLGDTCGGHMPRCDALVCADEPGAAPDSCLYAGWLDPESGLKLSGTDRAAVAAACKAELDRRLTLLGSQSSRAATSLSATNCRTVACTSRLWSSCSRRPRSQRSATQLGTSSTSKHGRSSGSRSALRSGPILGPAA
jgi:hypothetical protein